MVIEVRDVNDAASILAVPLANLPPGAAVWMEAAAVKVRGPLSLVVDRRSEALNASAATWGPAVRQEWTLASEEQARAFAADQLAPASIRALLKATLTVPIRLRLLGGMLPRRDCLVSVELGASGQGALEARYRTEMLGCEGCAHQRARWQAWGVLATCTVLVVSMTLRARFAWRVHRVLEAARGHAVAQTHGRGACCRGCRLGVQTTHRGAFLSLCGPTEAIVTASALLSGAIASADLGLDAAAFDSVLASTVGRAAAGAASFAVWVSLLRAARHRPACGAAHRTLLRSATSLAGFLCGAAPCFVAFVGIATAAFGAHAVRFSTLAWSSMTLFAVVNGDVMRDTFLAARGGRAQPLWASLAASAVLFAFVILLLFVVLTSCVALMEESFVLARPAHDVPGVGGPRPGMSAEGGGITPSPGMPHAPPEDSWSVEMAPERPGRSRVSGRLARRSLASVRAPWFIM